MPGRKSRIFIDADAFVALANPKDSNHKKALRLSRAIKFQKTEVFVSSFAIGEAITVISQKIGLNKAFVFGIQAYEGEVIIIDANRDQQLKALKRIPQQTSKNIRFADFINMVLMDELKIKIIFSFDKHYQKSGYELLSDEWK